MKTKIAILLLSIVLKACIKNEKVSADKKVEAQETTSEILKPLTKITYPEDELAQKNFVYDATGNLIKFNSISDTAFYTFTKDLIKRKWVNDKGAVISEQAYALDKNGRIVASTYTESAIGKIYETTYTYNAQGFLVKVLTKNFVTNKDNITEHIYQAENLVRTRYLIGDKLDMEVSYQYDTTKENKIALNVFTSVDEFFTNKQLGKVSKNVMIQSLSRSVQGDTMSYLKYRNEFDKDGYLVKTTEQDIMNEISVEKLYHYKTK
ncbi:DUF4595 domain-containing protein [Emticicia sp. C21]|uniref:DUF4595 domain-containing protein n=1 Tax=Emticicia sp. C21 TaxID=2302915 RepID=UPI000E342E2C|nr:DUF4595 domain-containing protein [Emticicia sp. C21]RFS17176.1 DUF4595 domain-containing protein [Emticicia sp. C21]